MITISTDHPLFQTIFQMLYYHHRIGGNADSAIGVAIEEGTATNRCDEVAAYFRSLDSQMTRRERSERMRLIIALSAKGLAWWPAEHSSESRWIVADVARAMRTTLAVLIGKTETPALELPQALEAPAPAPAPTTPQPLGRPDLTAEFYVFINRDENILRRATEKIASLGYSLDPDEEGKRPTDTLTDPEWAELYKSLS